MNNKRTEFSVKSLLVLLVSLVLSTGADNVDNYLTTLSGNGVSYSRTTFNNWGSTVTRSSVIKVFPTTKDQVKTVVGMAYSFQGDPAKGESPLRVRPIGSTHAYSDLYADENQVVVDMSQYRRNEADRIYHDVPRHSRPYYIVSFNPSVTMTDLLTYLTDNGLSMPSLPSVYQATPVGLVAAGGHGMSWLDGPVSSYITNIELINGQGDYRQFDVVQNADIFNLFRYHLGLCGVFIQLTLRVVPYQLMSKHYGLEFPVQNVFDNITAIQVLMSENHSWLATWQIFSSLSAANVSSMASNGGITSAWDPKTDLLSNVIFKELTSATVDILESANNKTVLNVTYYMNDGYSANCSLRYGYYTTLEETDPVPAGTYPIYTEFAFSIDENTLSPLTNIMQVLQDQVKTYATSNPSLPIGAVQFAFWKHNSTCLLCHSNVADSTVNPYAASGNLIFMVNFQFDSADKTAFNSLVETIYTAWKSANLISLPHLGKYVPEVSSIQTDIVTRLKPKITQFNSIRGDIQIDDIDMFTNSFLDTIVFSEKQRVVLSRTGGSGQGRLSASLSSVTSAILTGWLVVCCWFKRTL